MFRDIVIPVVGFVLICVFLFFSIFYIETTKCEEVSEMSQIETKFKFYGGCFVKENGKFIPIKNWRVVE